MVSAAGKELRCGVGTGAPWCLCGVRHRHVVKSAFVRAAQSCLGCQSSRIRHGSIGSVRTHTTVTRAANPTTSSKETIQPPLGTAPPVNLDIDPSGSIALIADSINVIKDGENVKQVPDDKVHVIDLKANPPKAIGTITMGKQPSGLSINPAGTLALVANREDKSISVLSINRTAVKLIDTVAMGDSVSHATFTPDGKRALAVKFPAHKISLLNVEGEKVTYRKLDLPTGLWPFNVAVAPGGRIPLTA